MARTAIGDEHRGHFRQEFPTMVNDVRLTHCGDLVPKAQTNENKKTAKAMTPIKGETDILALQSHQFAANQHAANFRRARTDFHQFSIAENA